MEEGLDIGDGRRPARRMLAAFFLASGANHFANPRFYEAIVPPSMKHERKRIVQISGVAELAGGIGVMIPSTRRLSGICLVALLAAIFPANLYMAREPESFKKMPRWALYGRLPLQPLMMLWAWRTTRS